MQLLLDHSPAGDSTGDSTPQPASFCNRLHLRGEAGTGARILAAQCGRCYAVNYTLFYYTRLYYALYYTLYTLCSIPNRKYDIHTQYTILYSILYHIKYFTQLATVKRAREAQAPEATFPATTPEAAINANLGPRRMNQATGRILHSTILCPTVLYSNLLQYTLCHILCTIWHNLYVYIYIHTHICSHTYLVLCNAILVVVPVLAPCESGLRSWLWPNGAACRSS